jgi:hypothetical protein
VVSPFSETEPKIPVSGSAGIEPCLNIDHDVIENGAVALSEFHRKRLGYFHPLVPAKAGTQ